MHARAPCHSLQRPNAAPLHLRLPRPAPRGPPTPRQRLVSVHGLLDSLRKAVRGGDGVHEGEGPDLVRLAQEGSDALGGQGGAAFGPLVRSWRFLLAVVLAVLLVGYLKRELEAFRAALLAMDADMVKVICCNQSIERLSLREALALQPPEPQEPRLGARRAIILSGMYPAEVQETIHAYRQAGLPETVWAAAVPQNYERRVDLLVDDVYGDHRYMQEQERLARLAGLDKPPP